MNKYTYFIIVEKAKNPNRLLYHARAEKIHNSNNLLCAFTSQTSNIEIISANACGTWKEAQEIAAYWNKCYQENGTSYIDYLLTA